MKTKQLFLIFSLISVFSSSLILSSAFEKECMPQFSLQELQEHYEEIKKIVANIKSHEHTDPKTTAANKNLVAAEKRLDRIDQELVHARNKCFIYRCSFGRWNEQEDCIKSKELSEEYDKALNDYKLAKDDYSYAQEQFLKSMRQESANVGYCIKQRRYNKL